MSEIVLLNTNKHVVSSGDIKLRASNARRFDDDDPDVKVVAGYAGVDTLEGQDAEDALRREGLSGEQSAESRLGDLAAKARAQINHAAVSGPLQIVVGDDLAPHGPPSGELSTRAAEHAKDPVHFGPNEAVAKVPAPVGAGVSDGNANSPAEIHNAQAEATQASAEVAAELVRGEQPDPSDLAFGLDGDGDGDGEDPAADPSDDDGEPAEVVEIVPATSLSEENSGDDLRAQASARGLATGGTKSDLVARIVEHGDEPAAPASE